ncbi:MAG: response regulator [Methanolinea sp.]|nr:response regulator [Methanolinea sp.]
MYRILVVDDDAVVTDILGRIIRQGGYDTKEAHSGEEALRILGEESFDLVFLDIFMEPMDGWETLVKIKEDEKTKGIPVMMITSKNVTPEDMRDYSDLIEDYVQKPITKKALHEVIRRFFERERELDTEVENAKETGVNGALLGEYRNLVREIDVKERLLLLLWNVHRLSSTESKNRAELLLAIGRMESDLQARKFRVEEIRRMRERG